MARAPNPAGTLASRMANATFKWEGDLRRLNAGKDGSGINLERVASEPGDAAPHLRQKRPGETEDLERREPPPTEAGGLVAFDCKPDPFLEERKDQWRH